MQNQFKNVNNIFNVDQTFIRYSVENFEQQHNLNKQILVSENSNQKDDDANQINDEKCLRKPLELSTYQILEDPFNSFKLNNELNEPTTISTLITKSINKVITDEESKNIVTLTNFNNEMAVKIKQSGPPNIKIIAKNNLYNMDVNTNLQYLNNNKTQSIEQKDNTLIGTDHRKQQLFSNKNDAVHSNTEVLHLMTEKEYCDNNMTIFENEVNKLPGEENNTMYNVRYSCIASPDIFVDNGFSEEFECTNTVNSPKNDIQEESSSLMNYGLKKNLKTQSEIRNNINKYLYGVPPPPCTISQRDLINSVISNREKIVNFTEANKNRICVSFTSNSLEDELIRTDWPQILKVNNLGLTYNLSKLSEEIELLNLSIIERHVKNETKSSFQLSPSPCAKKRKINLTKSPGSRLSHLAKRRAIFSSANLQISSERATNSISRRQILFNTRESKNKKIKVPTPDRRLYINKKSNVRTPSEKKDKRFSDIRTQGPSKETSKRALFQSPHKVVLTNIQKPIIKPELVTRLEKSKRALFLPDKIVEDKSNLTSENIIKRKRSLDNEITYENKEKILRYDSGIHLSDNESERSLRIKSQSFCATTSEVSNSMDSSLTSKFMQRSCSDTICSSQLSESHKKKLLWAVSQALTNKKIGTSHPDFKKYVSVLAKAIKRLFLEFYSKSSSASETLLKLSKKHVYSVLNGKTSDEIYLTEKLNLEKEKKILNKNFLPYRTENTENKKTRKNSENSASKNKLNNLQLKENANQYVLRTSGQKNFTGKDERNISPYFEKFNKLNSRNLVHGPITTAIDHIFKAKRQISFDD